MSGLKPFCGLENMCLQRAETFSVPVQVLKKLGFFFLPAPLLFSFCSPPTLVLCQRFYEGIEYEEPDCGMDLRLLPSRDRLRLFTDANIPSAALSSLLWSHGGCSFCLLKQWFHETVLIKHGDMHLTNYIFRGILTRRRSVVLGNVYIPEILFSVLFCFKRLD